jgi:hypothetical protein
MVKRYDCFLNAVHWDEGTELRAEMRETDSGTYVTYEDYARLEFALQRIVDGDGSVLIEKARIIAEDALTGDRES